MGNGMPNTTNSIPRRVGRQGQSPIVTNEELESVTPDIRCHISIEGMAREICRNIFTIVTVDLGSHHTIHIHSSVGVALGVLV